MRRALRFLRRAEGPLFGILGGAGLFGLVYAVVVFAAAVVVRWGR